MKTEKEAGVRAELGDYTTDNDAAGFYLLAEGGTVWLAQSGLADLFQTTKQNINLHIKNILANDQSSAERAVKDYLTTRTEDQTRFGSWREVESCPEATCKRGLQVQLFSYVVDEDTTDARNALVGYITESPSCSGMGLTAPDDEACHVA